METKFQTSFIPKKPIVTQQTVKVHSSINIFLIIGVLAFLASVSGAGFVVFWKSYLLDTQNKYQVNLQKNESQFNPELISSLQRFGQKITLANQLIKNHLEVTRVFPIIAGITAESVQYNTFSYDAPSPTSPNAKIALTGKAANFSTIVFQAGVLNNTKMYGTNKEVKNAVLSGLALSDKGSVGFSLTGELSPSYLLYSDALSESLGASGSATQ